MGDRLGAYANFRMLNKAYDRIVAQTGRKPEFCEGCQKFHKTRRLKKVCELVKLQGMDRTKARKLVDNLYGKDY